MRAFGRSNKGCVRPNNEDAYYLNAKDGIFLVADGMGGHVGGEVASNLAATHAIQGLQVAETIDLDMIDAAFVRVNAAIRDAVQADSELAGMGTTLTLVVVRPFTLFVGHIGDSRAYLIDDKSIRCLTSDHSVSGQLLAMGKITAFEAENHPQRNVLTRALGAGDDNEPELSEHTWVKGQYLLLCTDGLYNLLNDKEILAPVLGGGDLDDISEKLVATAIARGAPDNVTLVLVAL